MKKLLLLLSFIVGINSLDAQDSLYEYHDGHPWCKFSPATDNAGNLTKSLPTGPYPPNTQITCGAIRVTFMDVYNASGIGFDDSALGLTRRNCVCNAMNYIQSVIVFPASINSSNPVDVLFMPSLNTSADPRLGFAAPIFPPAFFASTPGYYSGYVYDFITTGVNPAPPNEEHGQITMNFGHPFSYCTPLIGDCEYDFESVVIHEFTHLLGIGSLISEDTGTLQLESGWALNVFTEWDRVYLYYLDAGGTFNKMVDIGTFSGTGGINPILPANMFGGWATANRVWTINTPLINRTNQPVHSRLPGFSLGTTLSHLDEEYLIRCSYSPAFSPNYVMNGSINTHRFKNALTKEELRILEGLGYIINTATVSNYTNLPPSINGSVVDPNFAYFPESTIPVGNANIYIATSNCNPVTINVLANSINNGSTSHPLGIYDAEGDPITIFDGQVFNLRGCSNAGNNNNQLIVSGANDVITFTPRTNFVGRAQFAFHLFDGKDRGAYVVITIDVNQDACFNNGTEHTINGSFDEGMLVRSIPTPNSTLTSDGIDVAWHYIGNKFCDGQQYAGAGWQDQKVRDSYQLCLFGSATYSFPAPGTAFLPTGGIGDRYTDFSTIEAFHVRLAPQLLNCHNYILEFDMTFSTPGVPVGTTVPFAIALRNTIGGTNLFSSTIPITNTGPGIWHHIVLPITYSSATPANYFFIDPVGFGYNHIDNLTIHDNTTSPGSFPTVTVIPSSPTICSGSTVNLTASGATTYVWSPGTGLSSTTTPTVTANPTTTTTYNVIGTDAFGCQGSTNATVNVGNPALAISGTTTICSGQSTTLTASGASTYLWSPSTGLSCTTCPNPVASPSVTTIYTVTGTDAGSGCTTTQTITITINPTPVVTATPTSSTILVGGSVSLTASGATTYSWSPATGLSCSNCSNPVASPTTTTVYTVTGTTSGCTSTATVTVTVITGCPGVNTMAANYNTNTTLSASGLWSASVLNTTITGGATLTLSGIELRMFQDFKITVTPGCTLKVIGGTKIWACTDDMWDGIEVQAGGRVEIFGDCQIEDAKIAVHSMNSLTTEAEFLIHDCIFNKNHKAIRVDPYPFSHNGLVYSTLFTSVASVLPQLGVLGTVSTLKNPYNSSPARKANMGVEVENVKSITIGSTLGMNTFNNLEVGIHSFKNTLLYSKNNKFQNITYGKICPSIVSSCFLQSTTGMGIWAELLGTIVVGGTTAEANTFLKCNNGVVARTDVNVFVTFNSFQQISAPIFTLSRCVLVENDFSGQTIKVNNNTFFDFKEGAVIRNYYNCGVDITNNDFKKFPKGMGIYCLQNTGSSLNIQTNFFNSTGIDNGSNAIRVQNAVLTGNGTVTIYANSIRNCVTGIFITNIQKPQIALHNVIIFNLSSPPPSSHFGVRMQNCPNSFVNDNDVYKLGLTTAGSTYTNKLYGYTFDVGCVGGTITNNFARRMNTGFRFSGSNNTTLTFGCNFIERNYYGVELNTTDIGDQGAVGTTQDNQWTLPNPSIYTGTFGAKNISSTIPDFYTRGTSTPWTLSSSQQTPTGAAVSFPFTTPTGYFCLYGCADPPCFHIHIAKIAKKESPFDSLSINNRDITYFNTYYQLKQDSSIYQQGTPDDAIILNFKDSLSYTNIGAFYEITEKALSGDTVNAKIINDAIVPRDCKEQSQKIVNKIFLSTWARGIFEFTPADSATLQTIADYYVEDCGLAVYDARVMLRYDKDDFPDFSHSMIYLEGTVSNNDVLGIMYPNPANTIAYYEIELAENESGFIQLFDLLGNIMTVQKLNAGVNKTEFDLSGFANGVYIYRVTLNGEFKVSDKLVITK